MLSTKSINLFSSQLNRFTTKNIRLISNDSILSLQQARNRVNTSEKILFEDLRTNTRNFDESELKAKNNWAKNTVQTKTWSTYKLPSKDSLKEQEEKLSQQLKAQSAAPTLSAQEIPSNDIKTTAISQSPAKLRRSAANTTSASRVANRRRNRQQKLKAPITLLPNALLHLKKLNNQPTPKYIKIGVTSRGCSGLSYDLQYVTEPNKYDEVVEQDGVKIIIDSKALLTIIGSEMDWIDDKLSNRFVFKNPNSKGTCGCGESFHV